jgi:curved DNA-binding protein CbpA
VEEIKKAYRRIAMATHPDRKPDDEIAKAQFHDAQEAYKVLSSPASREKYDQTVLNRFVDDPFIASEVAWNGFIDRTLDFNQGR